MQKCPLFSSVLQVLANTRPEREIKDIQIREGWIKLSLLTDNMIVQKILKDLQKNSGINDHSRVTGYKINAWKSIVFLSTSNKQEEFETKRNTIYISTEKIKYVDMNF